MAELVEAVAAMFDRLCAADAESRDWVTVAAEVMRLCVHHDPGADAWTELGWSTDAEELTAQDIVAIAAAQYYQHLTDDGGGDMLVASVPRLVGIRAAALEILDGEDRLVDCLRLFGLAWAIDNEIISRTATRRPSSSVVRLRTNDLVVTPDPIPGPRHGWATDPAKVLGRTFSRTRRLHLVPKVNFHITVDNRAWDILDQFFIEDGKRRDLVVAVAQPHSSMDSFEITFGLDVPGFGADRQLSELDVAVHESQSGGGGIASLSGKFTNKGPIDSLSAQRRASQIVAKAVAAGANVVLLPEYALADVDQFVEALGMLSLAAPTVVAAGVRRQPPSGLGSVSACRLWLCLPGTPRKEMGHGSSGTTSDRRRCPQTIRTDLGVGQS